MSEALASMRVCHVITRLIVGGAQENTIASVLGLRRRPGFAVLLVAGPTHGPEGSLESGLTGVPDLLVRAPSLVRPLHPWRDLKALGELTRLFRSWQPTVVHTHSGKAGFLGRLAARRARVPLVVHTIHGPSFGPFQGPLANGLFRLAERWAGRHTSHFVSVADAMTEQYLGAGIGRPDQYTRVRSGFDLAPFLCTGNGTDERRRWGLAPDDFVVGKIARLFALKGHDDLVSAAPEVVRRCPRVRFLLVGDGAWRGRLTERVNTLGLASRFVFTGLRPPEEMPRLVGAMDVLVHLSRREGLARALPQALAAGKPVVAWDVDGAGEVCQPDRTGFLLSAGDLAGLAEALGRLAADEELRRRLGEAGRALVIEAFSEQAMVDALADLYERLAREANLP